MFYRRIRSAQLLVCRRNLLAGLVKLADWLPAPSRLLALTASLASKSWSALASPRRLLRLDLCRCRAVKSLSHRMSDDKTERSVVLVKLRLGR